MSEFKFACPVCGQHITADSRTSGSQLNCPTCFQKIIVPQAPAAGTNLILSASQVGKPRPIQTDFTSGIDTIKPRRTSPAVFAFWGCLVIAIAASAFVFRQKITKLVSGIGSDSKTKSSPPKGYPIPTNFSWTMNVNNMNFPATVASGGIRGMGFQCEHATLQGGNLTLRQGRTWPPDLGITVQLFARQGEELSGKTVLVGPERPPPVPKIVLRWKDEQGQNRKQDFTTGYALKMSFGEAVDARMPGKIFISLPDEAKTFVAGTFEAEIKKAPPPKPH